MVKAWPRSSPHSGFPKFRNHKSMVLFFQETAEFKLCYFSNGNFLSFPWFLGKRNAKIIAKIKGQKKFSEDWWNFFVISFLFSSIFQNFSFLLFPLQLGEILPIINELFLIEITQFWRRQKRDKKKRRKEKQNQMGFFFTFSICHSFSLIFFPLI